MISHPKTAIVTGASQGIGAGIVKGFVERGFNGAPVASNPLVTSIPTPPDPLDLVGAPTAMLAPGAGHAVAIQDIDRLFAPGWSLDL